MGCIGAAFGRRNSVLFLVGQRGQGGSAVRHRRSGDRRSRSLKRSRQAAERTRGLGISVACRSCRCSLNAVRNLFGRPIRWIHRFTIYSGCGATFAAMGAVGLELQTRGAAGRWATAAFIGTYVIGSAGIFPAKTLAVRRAVKSMPQCQEPLGAGGDNQGYW
jgi:hypothetical protein